MKHIFFSFFRSTSFDASYNIFSKEKNDQRALCSNELKSAMEWLSDDHSPLGLKRFNEFNKLEEILENRIEDKKN